MNSFLLLAALSPWVKPLWIIIAGSAGAAMLLWVVVALLELVLPKVGAVAYITAKEIFALPLFYVVLALGVAFLILFTFLPYNTFGEDIKMVKDQGFVLIMLLAMFLALWTASASIADEIEGRTALMLLSKPIGRREFMCGKFLGIVVPVAAVFIVLGAVFLSTVSYKVAYDAREGSALEPTSAQCRGEVLQTIPGLVLAFMETVTLTSISVAISTRLPMLPNLMICATVYVLGHMGPLLLKSSVGQFEIVGFVARFFSTILPVLDHFNVQAAVATGLTVPLSYLAWAGVYCALYSAVAMVLALLLFEDRDLA
jgi:ABC-type transport system involved in multi-copper enzyme maturation permease subunit